MRFDVRYPIGLLFLAIGVMVAIRGLSLSAAGRDVGGGALSFGNIDLDWGVVMGVFGAFMLLLAIMESRRRPPP